MNSQSDLEKAWCEAFQIRKAFIDHFDRAVPEELLRFTHQRLDAINALTHPRLLTEEDIIDRAAARARPSWTNVFVMLGALFLTAGVALAFPAVDRFVQKYPLVWLGILIGSLAQTGVVFASRWAWDRWLWLKWFSRQ
jgi:hypothetical protein